MGETLTDNLNGEHQRPQWYGGTTPTDLYLAGNQICPNVDGQGFATTTYPECLSPNVNSPLWEEIATADGTNNPWRLWELWISNN